MATATTMMRSYQMIAGRALAGSSRWVRSDGGFWDYPPWAIHQKRGQGLRSIFLSDTSVRGMMGSILLASFIALAQQPFKPTDVDVPKAAPAPEGTPPRTRTPSITVSCRPGTQTTREELFSDLDRNLRLRWGLSFQDPKPTSGSPQDDDLAVRTRLNQALAFPKVTGTMGVNSTPASRAIDPRVPEYYSIGTGFGFKARGSEKAFTVAESLDMPIGERIAFELSLPFEYSRISEARRQELGLPSTTASQLGDVAWAFRWHILKSANGDWYDPDVAVRAYTQSASGMDDSGRSYDAARYAVELDLGETFYKAPTSLHDLQEVRGVFMAGLDVPQARDRQIDRLSYGAAANIYFRDGWRVDTGLYGYEGYADMDSQLNLFSTIYVPLTERWNVAIDATCGLTEESPDYGFTITFGFGDKTPYPR